MRGQRLLNASLFCNLPPSLNNVTQYLIEKFFKIHFNNELPRVNNFGEILLISMSSIENRIMQIIIINDRQKRSRRFLSRNKKVESIYTNSKKHSIRLEHFEKLKFA